MISYVGSSWLKEHLREKDLRVVDPRPPVRYLLGHVRCAVNLPVQKIFDKRSLRLLPERELAVIFGNAGVDSTKSVVLYDDYDGQSAAMLGWALAYLGHKNVGILSTFFEKWIEDGYEVMYRPVIHERRKFQRRPNIRIRATTRDILAHSSVKLLDARSADEFHGLDPTEPRAGHLPGAVNLPWTVLLGNNRRFLRPRKELRRLFAKKGIKEEDRIVTYCRTGPRAAVAYLALRSAGYEQVRLYDASFHQWCQKPELPVEC